MHKLLLITLLFTIIATSMALNKHANLSQAQNDLKYYHRYESNHAAVTPNPKIPLNQHYSNERDLRKKAYALQDKIHQVAHDAEFKVRDMNRAKLALQNRQTTLKAERKADQNMADQREEAIKYEINHDEKFREMYQDRLQKNRHHAEHALPNLRGSDAA